MKSRGLLDPSSELDRVKHLHVVKNLITVVLFIKSMTFFWLILSIFWLVAPSSNFAQLQVWQPYFSMLITLTCGSNPRSMRGLPNMIKMDPSAKLCNLYILKRAFLSRHLLIPSHQWKRQNHQVNNKDARMTPAGIVLVSLFSTLNILHTIVLEPPLFTFSK